MSGYGERLVVLVPLVRRVTLQMLELLHSRISTSLDGMPVRLRYLFTLNAEDEDPIVAILEEFKAKIFSDATWLLVPGASGPITDAGGGRYVYGYFEAAKMGECVVDIDFAGAHNPDVIYQILTPMLDGTEAVLSVRFGMKGAADLYPLQRQLSSIAITVLSNLFLGLGIVVTDMASGYQGFRSSLLLEIAKIHPPEEWITLGSTTALVETELRACVLWYLRSKRKNWRDHVHFIPIVYGAEKKGAKFPVSVGVKALCGFFQLARYRKEYLRKVKAS